MRKALLIVSVAVFGLSFGCGGKDAKDKPATAVDTVAAVPDTATTFTDKRDGKVYRIVKIGGQTWFAENLNYAAKGSVCYDNKAENCAKYGRLYDWATAMKACPAGTHLPTNKEWTTLTNYAGGEEKAGTKLKSSAGWMNDEKVPAGTNEYGFSALPGGARKWDGSFSDTGHYGYWWSATKTGSSAFQRHLCYDYEFVEEYNSVKTFQFSVRCVLDDQNENKDGSKPVNLKKDGDKTTFTDKRDGNVYKIVKIGRQVWFAENLNYAAERSKCYDNNAANCAKYGRLYNWATALKACPAGFHLPTDGEWTALVDYAGGEKTAGTKLKSAAGWNENGNGTNDFGWSALPGGYGYSDGSFNNAGYNGIWWSATEFVARHAWTRYMIYYNGNVFRGYYFKTYLSSVRCVADKEGEE